MYTYLILEKRTDKTLSHPACSWSFDYSSYSVFTFIVVTIITVLFTVLYAAFACL